MIPGSWLLGSLMVLALLLVGALLVLLRGGRGQDRLVETLATGFQKSLGELSEKLSLLAAETQVIARQQESLRGQGQETERGLQSLETKMVETTAVARSGLAQTLGQVQEVLQANLASAQTTLRQEITQTRELLAQVKSAEEVREAAVRQALESLRRLEHVIAGTKSRGMAGENILGGILAQLPPELRETNLTINNKVVEFAFRLPNDKVLPIDSKWPSMATLEKLADTDEPAARRPLIEAIQGEVKKKVKEAAKYLDPDRTIQLGVVVVPDAVFDLCFEVHVEAFKQGIVIVSYSQALPYLLSLLQVVIRFSAKIDAARLSSALKTIADALEKMEGEVEGRLAKSLTQLENSRGELRAQLSRARQGAGSLYLGEGSGGAPPSLTSAD
ncbi:MAG TPA: DNA recombination protein RmuC [Candidatus Methylomirabilis sp.]|nr:DNA recombination protein RmuC [Candidatus Methylomirabilis sp.]